MRNDIESEHKRLNRLSIAAHGMRECVNILLALEQRTEVDVLYEAALSYAVILYARPFTENEKSPNANAMVKIKSKSILKELEPRQRVVHERLIELRNRALAHAEWKTHPTKMSNDSVIRTKPFSIMSVLQDVKVDELRELAQNVHIAIENERATSIALIQYLGQ